MKKSLIALAFGTLGLGIAEFAMMGILGSVAENLQISISAAGHLISAYALGVCLGAPVLLLVRKYPLKKILLLLVTIIVVGNLCAAAASDYWMLLLARFLSGFPHGAYFGVASIVVGRQRKRFASCIGYDCRHDHRHSIWCTSWNCTKQYYFMAAYFPAGSLLEFTNVL